MFSIKRGDRRPYLEVILEERITDGASAAYNLTGLTVRFLMRNKVTGVLKVDQPATIVTATDGRVRYAWGAADTDTVGLYQVEWEINYGTGVTQTVPGSDYQYVNVTQDLG